MQNNINVTSPEIRDFLLNRNIISDSISNNGLLGLLNGIGSTSSIETLPESVTPSNDIEIEGIDYRKSLIINNKIQGEEEEYRRIHIDNNPGNRIPNNVLTGSDDYQNSNLLKNIYRGDESMYTDSGIILNTAYQPSSQMGSYLDEFGELNLGGSSTKTLNILGSLLNGGGVGFNPNGGKLEPNFDIRSSLSGRVLSAGGLLKDTKLGQISAGYLAIALGNNIAFNIQEEILGKVNLNPLNLIMGGELFKTDYTITTAITGLGKTVDIIEKLTGFERPVSIIDNSASIFVTETGDVDYTYRNNSLIQNTGKGQVLSLFKNLNANTDRNLIGEREGYAPKYEDDRTERGFNKAVYSGVTYDEAKPDYIKNGFNWIGDGLNQPIFDSDDENTPLIIEDDFKNKKGLLYKTKELFNGSLKNKIRTLTTGTYATEVGNDGTTIEVPKGSGVKDLKTNTYCRAWTNYKQYDSVDNLQKNSGLDKSGRASSEGYESFSVLDDNGFVKVTPYGNEDSKKFMFSIENLAWAGDTHRLLPSEIGNGDLVTGAKGRIMWFPPYNISFNESTSVSWDKSNFIGRGEPIYTYNNTERTGNLSWTMIIDHPNYLNFMKGKSNDEITSFFAGCLKLEEVRNQVLTEVQKAQFEVDTHRDRKNKVDNTTIPETMFTIYFSHNNSEIPDDYENGLQNGSSPIDYSGSGATGNGYGLLITHDDDNLGNYIDNTNFGINGANSFMKGIDGFEGWLDSNFITYLKNKFENEFKYCKIILRGYSSNQGDEGTNTNLTEKRLDSVKKWILDRGILPKNDEFGERRFKKENVGGAGYGCSTNDSIDSITCKQSRKVVVFIEYDPLLKHEDEINESTENNEVINVIGDLNIPISRFYNESSYFDKLSETDPIIYNKIKDKIKYFHPSFHSTTPEGFNSRLTFLQQCTRQGPTTNNAISNPNNLAFGRPPVCILRIGDFYNTKIIIDSLTFDYDPMVWDLNPEGVGVQPMFVTVNISFAFIGGSSLTSPINKLQNAVSFNYFANSQIYEPRSEKVEDGKVTEGTFPDKENKLKESDKVNKPKT